MVLNAAAAQDMDDNGERMEGYPEALVVSPPDWPEKSRDPRPGALDIFVPQGFGLGAPAIIMPYGGAPKGSYYGFDSPHAHPFLNAPTTEPSGGTFYFDDDAKPEALDAVLSLVGVRNTKDYAAYAASSADPLNERYLDQLRLVSNAALSSLFSASSDEPLPPQTLDAPSAVIGFVAAQRAKWKDDRTYSEKLAGSAGGDGDWAKESLCFGFHAENSYWGVYRVWSRAWLVTK
jgi:hypothetical protein